jgi:HAD superfamily hydrolase (TIGR01484 family)
MVALNKCLTLVQSKVMMMHKLLVFDLDGTLAEIGKGMLPEDVAEFHRLEKSGYRIAICSGKPVFYLCGFMRQVGLKDPILIGENGAVFQFGVELPPRVYYRYPCTETVRRQLRKMREMIDEACGEDVWYQPNDVALTPFPKNDAAFDLIQELIDTHIEELSGLHVYRHSDSFDIIPGNINKFSSLELLTQSLSITSGQVIAYGDWTNDIPMFEFADMSVKIGRRLKYETDLTYDTIGEALRATGRDIR